LLAAGGEVQREEREYPDHPGLYPRDRGRVADEDVRARHSSKQLHGQAHGGAGRSGSGPAAEHPPAQYCSKPYPLILSFCEIRPKFELKPKFHQNKSCAKFYKLQIIFW